MTSHRASSQHEGRQGQRDLVALGEDTSLHRRRRRRNDAGIRPANVRRINQIITNSATQHMRSPISPTTENVALVGGKRVVIVLSVAEGLDKPYFDRHGVMWVKTGSDRRRIQIAKLRRGDRLRRVGSRKTGRWEIVRQTQ